MLPKLLAVGLAALPAAGAEIVLGLYVFHRHGDRTAKAWTPVNLTALGADQVFASGTYYRGQYVAASAPQLVRGISTDIAVQSQLAITAPIDPVLQPSANVWIQALYPPAGQLAVQTLANGSTAEAPLGGYQYVPVNAVTNTASSQNSEGSAWLQGSSGCGNAVVSSNEYFQSPEYLATYNRTFAFYQGIEPVINGTYTLAQDNFKNAYTIFDLINVATIHNQSIPSDSLLTNDTLFQLRTLADQHEWGLAYNASSAIRAISGAVLAGQIVQALNATLTTKSAPRINAQFGAYGTFMSFFGLANLTAASPDFYGVVNYAASMVFELVTNSTDASPSPSDVSVRFLFTNGSASDSPPQPYPLFGQGDALLSWAAFAAGMSAFDIANTVDWCAACGNSTGVCAPDQLGTAGGNSSGSGPGSGSSGGGGGGGHISNAVAGVIGALVTLAVVLGAEVLLMAVAGLRLARKRGAAAVEPNGSGPK